MLKYLHQSLSLFNPRFPHATRILKSIDERIEAKHLLKHDFYQAWNRGELSQECLKEYGKEYYHHVKAFPGYLSAVHSQMDDQEDRLEILKI